MEVLDSCLRLLLVFKMFSLGRVVLYTVFIVFPLPETLVKTLAKNLVKNLAENLSKNVLKLFLINNCGSNILVFLWFLEVLEGLARSGRLIGIISFYFHRNPTVN